MRRILSRRQAAVNPVRTGSVRRLDTSPRANSTDPILGDGWPSHRTRVRSAVHLVMGQDRVDVFVGGGERLRFQAGMPTRRTLGTELVRCHVPERAVWTVLSVVDAGFVARRSASGQVSAVTRLFTSTIGAKRGQCRCGRRVATGR